MAKERVAKPVWMLLTLGAVALIFLLMCVAVGGPQSIPLSEIVSQLLAGPRENELGVNYVVWQLRLPVALACVMVGGALGLVGSAFQALFRNPLADPFIVGVASGAAVGGVAVQVLGIGVLGMLTLPAAGFVTGMGSLCLVLFLSRRRGLVDVSSLLLAGSVTGSLLAAIQSLLLLLAGKDSNQVLRWLLGNMQGAMFWERVALLTASLAVGGTLLVRQGRRLNALAVGEDAASRLGVNVRRLRNQILVIGTAMVAICVGTVGIIGFVGLASPHIARRLVGVDWRWSLMGSMLTGSSMLLLASTLAQKATPNGDLPVGIVTALIGAPFLLLLLRRD